MLKQVKQKKISDLIASSAQRFRSWQVESLLNRSADLLDRSLADSNLYRDLLAKAKNSEIDLTAAKQAVDVQTKREANGDVSRILINLKAQRQKLIGMTAMCNSAAAQLGNARTNRTDNALAESEAVFQQANIAVERNGLEIMGLTQAIDWQTIDETLQLRERDDYKKQLELRISAAEAGQPLDFIGHANDVYERLSRDVLEACEMLQAASTGMREIYNYPVAFEDVLKGPSVIVNLPQIEQIVGWNRQAIRWLTAFGQNDQSFTVSVSLRDVLNTQWTALLKGNTTLKFRLPKVTIEAISKFHYVRLRGVSATSISQTLALYPISVNLRFPKKAKYTYKDTEPSIVDQLALPECRVGRVIDIRLPGNSEIYGQVALMNASPCGVEDGNGLFEVSLISIVPKFFEKLEDVVVDLRLTGQPG